MTALLVLSIIAIALIGLLAAGEILVAMVILEALRKLLLHVRAQVPTGAEKLNALLRTANRVAKKVQVRTVKVADGVAHAGDTLLRFADRASGIAQYAIVLPVIETVAAARGLRRGFRVWRAARRLRQARLAPVESPPRSYSPEEATSDAQRWAA